jgi:hypothetical protein
MELVVLLPIDEIEATGQALPGDLHELIPFFATVFELTPAPRDGRRSGGSGRDRGRQGGHRKDPQGDDECGSSKLTGGLLGRNPLDCIHFDWS